MSRTIRGRKKSNPIFPLFSRGISDKEWNDNYITCFGTDFKTHYSRDGKRNKVILHTRDKKEFRRRFRHENKHLEHRILRDGEYDKDVFPTQQNVYDRLYWFY